MKAEEFISEYKKGRKAVRHNPKPRNPVAHASQSVIGGSASGAHKDKTKEIPRHEKHKTVAVVGEAGSQQGDAMAHAKRPGDGVDAGSEMDDQAHRRLKGVARAVDKLSGTNEATGGATETQVYQYMIRQAPEFMKTAITADVKRAIAKAMSYGSQISVPDLASYAYGILKTNDLDARHEKHKTVAVVGEAGGYDQGRADPHAPSLGAQDRREFKRAELQHELGDERNNIAVSINGKLWKVFAGKGYADSIEERQYLNHMRSWAEKKSAATGKKWSVSLTGAEPTT